MSHKPPVAFLLLVVLIILAVVVCPLCVQAESAETNTDVLLESGIRSLAVGGFPEKASAIDRLAAGGDARAVPVFEALLDGRLYARRRDGAALIGGDGADKESLRLTDPVTGADLGTAPAAEFEKLRINNKIRGQLRGAIAGLTLLHPDPGRRREAAVALFKSQDSTLLPTLETALAREDKPWVADAFRRTRAALRLKDADPVQRLAAVRELAAYADPEVRSLIGSLLVERAGAPTEPDAHVRTAASQALATIERRLAGWAVAGYIYQGLSLGSVLLLAAIGLAITFGVMGVINMAHGEMVMIGAYTTYLIQESLRLVLPGWVGATLILAIPLSFLVAGLVGIAIERGIIRHLYGRPLETLLATWGISLILQQGVRSVFGPTNREVSTPSWLQGAFETSVGITLTYNRLTIILFSLAVLAGLMLLLRRTALGLHMRAVTQNRRMAGVMGIPTGRVDALTFGLGSGIAGMAGVALSQIDNVSPNLGQGYIIDSFMVVVFGGVGNLWGTLAGALSLGVANKLLEPYAGAVLGKILVLVAIILFIQKRPRGLFALKGRAVEA
jgi:urea transport system permease protein